ncbi:MAG TPA: hypothetical protein VNW97_06760 [Candidatus Saccharimonadales bacterium]|jgi:hypothetical protein|nr:hypothetical protein [Candidatus Saccharimonadales bacterium]
MAKFSKPLAVLFLSVLVPAPLAPKAFTAPRDAVLQVSGGDIDVALPEGPLGISQDELLNWVRSSAEIVAQYYGRFPVRHLTLTIRSGGGSGIHHGVTYSTGGGLIRITVGQNTGHPELNADWVLIHEMFHLGFPSLDDKHDWLEEGLSTYLEPVARAQTGHLPVTEVWKQFILDMPKGQPEAGDEGLDNTQTWGRTYWGGAIFCLVADVQIREHTHNRKGLQDALRAIVNGGGVISSDWDIEKALATGDRETGTNVLRNLYREMSRKPVSVDLDQLWRKLGMKFKDGAVTFDDKAPEAGIRRAITERRPSGQR